MPYSVILSGPEDLEFLCITLHSCTPSCCLGVLYNLPDNVSHVLSKLDSVLQTLPPTLFSNFVLLGDFNVNYLDTSNSVFCLLDNILSNYNLFQVVQEPTRVASTDGATLIDLALVSNPEALELSLIHI